MIVLGIETSTRLGSVALRRAGALLEERVSEPRKGHGGPILGEIDRLLSAHGLTLAEVDLIAAGAGPGSFTGLRVGLATAAALGWAAGCRVTGVDSLRALAENAPEDAPWVAATIDARKSEVFAALYRREGGALTEVIEAAVLKPDALRARIDEANGGAGFAAVGTGAAAHPAVLGGSAGEARIRAAVIAAHAEALAGQGELPPPRPRYVRLAEAEVKFGAAPAHDPMAELV